MKRLPLELGRLTAYPKRSPARPTRARRDRV